MCKKSIFIMNSIFSFLTFELFRLIKLTYLIGSKKCMFSAINIMGPLSGLSSMTFSGLFLCIARDTLYFGLSSPLVYHIPTLCASAYWMTPSPIVRLFVPIVCMILFNLHPVGSVAWTYSLYWLIPLVIYWSLSDKNIVGQAFGSTFVAHAVGSVVWLYTVPMTSQQWISLIPQVALERSIFACGIVIVYYAINYCVRATKHLTATRFSYAHK